MSETEMKAPEPATIKTNLPFPDLTPGTHLLFDNAAAADTFRLRRVTHEPAPDPVEPVLTPRVPSDGASVTPLHVTYEAARKGGKPWRMWYQAHDPVLEEERKALKKSKYGNLGEPQPIYMCYAESNDGVEWDRPALGIHTHHARSTEPTNISFKGFSYAAGNTIIHQPDAPPDRRYLLVNGDWHSDRQGGVYVATSPDGLRWNYTQGGAPIVFGESDTWNSICFNPERGVYMLYMRGWHTAASNWPDLKKNNQRRRVAYSESKDLKVWTEPQVIITPDELDTNDFYGFQVFRHRDYYLGFLWIHDDDGDETIEVQLAFSKDGVHWSRLPQRPTFLRHGRPGELDSYMVIPAQQPTVTEDAMYVYVTGHHDPHDAAHRVSSVGFRRRLRLDGFVSLHADRRPGAMISRPFTLQSDSIRINAATYGDGEILAELVEPYYHEPAGLPVEGFSAADSVPFQGDQLAHKLTWKGGSDLRSLRGRRLLLRMQLRHADLYSFTV